MQVDVIEDDYGATVYKDGDVNVVQIDLRQWSDEYPTRPELDKLKEQVKLLTHPDAIKFMDGWIKENEEGLEDSERENDLDVATLKERLTEAKAFLESNGYEVTP